MPEQLKSEGNPLGKFLDRYENNPVLAVREWYAGEPDDWQVQALTWYGNRERHISIRSAPGPGKTTLAAWAAIHQILTRFPQKTIVTAPSSPQLFDALWPEINVWVSRLPKNLKDLLDVRSDHIYLKASPDESFISARTARAESPENFQGIHSPNTLLVFDEASGIPETIYEAALGSESDKNFTFLLISNPVRREGFFYNTHTENRDFWKTLRVGYQESSRIDRNIVEMVKRTYGEESNAFRIRCLGEFPTEEADTLIPFEICEAARVRDVHPTPGAGRVWGLDVARFGMDSSALCKRFGNVVPEPVRLWRGRDTMQTVGIVKAEWDSTPPSERPQEILVDVIGLGGGVVDRLRELKLPIRGINVGESPSSNPGKFANVKAELWSKAREWLYKRAGKLPDDDILIKGLSSVHYGYTSDGKLKIEAKTDTKAAMTDDAARRQGAMDAADAFVLTFASDVTTMILGSGYRKQERLSRQSNWVI
jgi:hypothetical protein